MRPLNVENIFAQINDDATTIENNRQIHVNVRMEIFALLGLKALPRERYTKEHTANRFKTVYCVKNTLWIATCLDLLQCKLRTKVSENTAYHRHDA